MTDEPICAPEEEEAAGKKREGGLQTIMATARLVMFNKA